MPLQEAQSVWRSSTGPVVVSDRSPVDRWGRLRREHEAMVAHMGKEPYFARDKGGRRFARDVGDVYETKRGDRWRVVGTNAKGRVIVRRAGHRYEGELQWSPEVLKRMKPIHAAESRAVAEAVAPIEKADSPGIFGGLLGGLVAPDPDGRRRRKVYLNVGERITRYGTRVIGIVLSQKRGKCCPGCRPRKDLSRVFYSVRNARKAQHRMAAILRRRRGVKVRMG